MRYIILVKACADSEACAVPDDALSAAMTRYHEQLAQAGVLLDGAALRAHRDGWRIRLNDGRRTLLDGPAAQGRELVAGYTVIQVRTREEALEWTRRFPLPDGPSVVTEIEVHALCEPDDFGADAATTRFRHVTSPTAC